MACMRIITTRTIRQSRPPLEEVNRGVGQFGIDVPGEVQHVELGARAIPKSGNWPILTNCSNAFNTASKTVVLAEVAYLRASAHAGGGLLTCQCSSRWWPSSTGRDPPMSSVDSEEHRAIFRKNTARRPCVGPTISCLPLRPALTRSRAEFEEGGVEALAYVDNIALGLMGSRQA